MSCNLIAQGTKSGQSGSSDKKAIGISNMFSYMFGEDGFGLNADIGPDRLSLQHPINQKLPSV